MVVASTCSEKSLRSRLVSGLYYQRWALGRGGQSQLSAFVDKAEQKRNFKCPEAVLEEW